MGPPGWITLIAVVILLVVLAWELVHPSVAVLATTITLFLLGVIDADQAFSGFSNEAPIVVASLLVLARAVDVSGIMQPIVAGLFGAVNSPRLLLARLLGPLAALSGFLNNTTLVAMALPAVLDLSQRRNLSPSRFLMPVSFAAVLGGVITAIGTSTNLTVSGLLSDAGMEPLSLFELTPVGLPIAAAGCATIVLLAGRLLPDRGSTRSIISGAGRDFSVTMRVVRGGAADGLTVEAAGLRALGGVFLVEIQRDGQVVAPVAPEERLVGGDLLTFVGRVDQIVDLQRIRGLRYAANRQINALARGAHAFYEVVIGGGQDLAGRTLKELGFRARYQAAVLAIHRAGQRVDAKLGEVRLRLGDTLLVLADTDFRDRWRDQPDFLVIAPVHGAVPPRGRRVWLVAAIGLAFVVLTGTGLVSILQASLLTALLIVAFRILTIRQARDAIDLDIVILIAAAFGLGAAVDSSGLGQVIADIMLMVMGPLGNVGALAGVLIATMILTELISNNAAAVLAFPVALATAAATGTDPRPYVIAVAMGASLSFLTPIGYQTNLMVYGLGGYRFWDFTRLGLPINLVCIAGSLLLIPIFFPF
jgi:di/tricarboxylate transporter